MVDVVEGRANLFITRGTRGQKIMRSLKKNRSPRFHGLFISFILLFAKVLHGVYVDSVPDLSLSRHHGCSCEEVSGSRFQGSFFFVFFFFCLNPPADG